MSERFTNMRDLISALAISMNLINPDMQHHHEQTAYLAYQIGYEMGLRDQDLNNAVYAALLHDIGTVVSPEQCAYSESGEGNLRCRRSVQRNGIFPEGPRCF